MRSVISFSLSRIGNLEVFCLVSSYLLCVYILILISTPLVATYTILSCELELVSNATIMSNAWSNRGAITTTFTPPSSCFTTTFDTLVTEMSFFHVAHWGGYGKGYGGSCYPSSASTVTFGGPATSDTAFGNYYYSPALICPSGWTTARSLSLTPSDGFTTTSGVSAYLCCPR